MKRRILWTPETIQVTVNNPSPSSSSGTQTIIIQSKIPRNGNGHKAEKRRHMLEKEQSGLRSRFLRLNGQFKEDDCVRFKQTYASDSINEVGIFQITGYVSYLHREVACGRIKVGDIRAYKSWMHEKYPALMNFYDNEHVREVREQNWNRIANGLTPDIPIKREWTQRPAQSNVTVTNGPVFANFRSRKRTI